MGWFGGGNERLRGCTGAAAREDAYSVESGCHQLCADALVERMPWKWVSARSEQEGYRTCGELEA